MRNCFFRIRILENADFCYLYIKKKKKKNTHIRIQYIETLRLSYFTLLLFQIGIYITSNGRQRLCFFVSLELG